MSDVCRGKGGIEAVEPTLQRIGVKVGQVDGGGGGSRSLLLLIVGRHACFGVKSVTSVAEVYTTRPNKDRASIVLYVYLTWRVDRWDNKERYTYEPPLIRIAQ
jgi:hypothetical protein